MKQNDIFYHLICQLHVLLLITQCKAFMALESILCKISCFISIYDNDMSNDTSHSQVLPSLMLCNVCLLLCLDASLTTYAGILNECSG